jgi:Ca2+-binding RTX toxin-like protein
MAPTATAKSYATDQAAFVAGNIIMDDTGNGRDSDPAGVNDHLVIVGHTNPGNGYLVINPDGSFVYTPHISFSGTDSFAYVISDGDGGSSTNTVTITVTGAAAGSVQTVADTRYSDSTALLIAGTSGDDTISVEPGATSSQLDVTINGIESAHAWPSGRIIVMGGAGNDHIQIANSIFNLVWLYGDAGDDTLFGGGGASLLIGGDGNDQLHGGGGRDVIIGGNGADRLIGNNGDDILVAGFTNYDDWSSAEHEDFWSNILSEWTSANSFQDRIDNLRGSATQKNNAHNGTWWLLPQVVDDVFNDDIDFLNGSAGDDWLLFSGGEDKVSGKTEASDNILATA